MARWVRCTACGGTGKVPCWRCGDRDTEEQDLPLHFEDFCKECYDEGTEPCEECNTEGGYYAE